MLAKKTSSNQSSFFFSLEDTLNRKHPLYILANRIYWQRFEDAFSPLYCADNGRPVKPIRLMVGLLILKHIRNVSDESVVEQWAENLYYQYFCMKQMYVAFQKEKKIRNRIWEQGFRGNNAEHRGYCRGNGLSQRV